MTEDERCDLIDRLPDDMTLWADDEEIEKHGCAGRDYTWWREALGHPKAHPGCCKTCGCAITCSLAAFYEAVVDSVVRELDKIGALRRPEETSDAS